MLRRVFWAATGVGFGVGGSFWVRRAVRQTVDRYRPGRVHTDVVDVATRVGRDVRAAAAEGARAMREREAALREQIGDPTRAARAARAVPAASQPSSPPTTP